MTKWTVVFTPVAQKQFRKLSKEAQKRISDFSRQRIEFNPNPKQLAKKLSGDLGIYWKFRIGNFRLIVEFNEKQKEISVVTLGDRKAVYKHHKL
jgi:mRNA interferase RelE/StbE